MFAVVVSFDIKPEAVAQFMPLMLENARASLRDEAGCHQFDVCHEPDDENTVFLYELYSDEAAFKVHLASDHFKQFDADVADLVTSKQVACYHRSFPS